MTMITPSYLGETIEYSSLHACRSTLEDPTGDGQEPDEGHVPAVDSEDDGHDGGPDEGDQRRHRLSPIGAVASGGGLKLLVSWFGHVLSPRSPP